MRVSADNPSVPQGGHRPSQELEQALGLSFQDRGLLRQALTHRSWVNEQPGEPPESYERLEFLGDVVVRLIVSEELYRRLPDCDEGGLTRRWTTLLSQRGLAAVGRRLNLADYVLLGRGSETTGSRTSPSILGDVMESLIAAVYLDGGLEAARRFVLNVMSDEIDATCYPDWRPHNPKADLQELLQSSGQSAPAYRVVATSGPPHNPQFTVEVIDDDDQVLGEGTGGSKSAAETEAAEAALGALTARQ
jgi:ribonuclease-3